MSADVPGSARSSVPSQRRRTAGRRRTPLRAGRRTLREAPPGPRPSSRQAEDAPSEARPALDAHVRADRPRRLVRLGGVALRGPEVAALLRGAALAHEDVAELGGRAERAVRRGGLAETFLGARRVAVTQVELGEHEHRGRGGASGLGATLVRGREGFLRARPRELPVLRLQRDLGARREVVREERARTGDPRDLERPRGVLVGGGDPAVVGREDGERVVHDMDGDEIARELGGAERALVIARGRVVVAQRAMRVAEALVDRHEPCQVADVLRPLERARVVRRRRGGIAEVLRARAERDEDAQAQELVRRPQLLDVAEQGLEHRPRLARVARDPRGDGDLIVAAALERRVAELRREPLRDREVAQRVGAALEQVQRRPRIEVQLAALAHGEALFVKELLRPASRLGRPAQREQPGHGSHLEAALALCARGAWVIEEVGRRLAELARHVLEGAHRGPDLPELDRAHVRAREIWRAELGLRETRLRARLAQLVAELTERRGDRDRPMPAGAGPRPARAGERPRPRVHPPTTGGPPRGGGGSAGVSRAPWGGGAGRGGSPPPPAGGGGG